MKLLATLGLGAMLLLGAATAEACGAGGGGDAILHKALPGLIPADAIVAEVELSAEFELRPNFATQLRGRVVRMIQGDYSGTTLFVRFTSLHCQLPFGNGMTGILIGTPDGMEDGVLVVVPILAPDSNFPSPLDALLPPARQGGEARPLL